MRYGILSILVATAFLVSCSSSDDILGSLDSDPTFEADWANDAPAAMIESLSDPQGDFELGDKGAPPYSAPVAYSPIDLTQVTFGLVDDYVYMQLEFDGTIPEGPQSVPASGEVEEQYVLAQDFKFVLDTDNNDATGGTGFGVDGVDICFGVHTDYDAGLQIDAAYGLSSGPISTRGAQLQGELGAGGPGTNFVLVRFDVSGIDPTILPRGSAVEVGGWSVAESDLYDDMSTDTLRTSTWNVPFVPVGGGDGGSELDPIGGEGGGRDRDPGGGVGGGGDRKPPGGVSAGDERNITFQPG